MRCAGMMGWTEREYWLSTPRFFYNAWMGWQRTWQVQYETARYSAFLTLAPQAPKGRRLRLEDLGRFDWEKAARSNLGEEQKEALRAMWEKINN